MRLLGRPVLDVYGGRWLNTHPRCCLRSRACTACATRSSVKVTGVTVFLVDEGIDTGPIVRRRRSTCATTMTDESLEARVLEVEHWLPAVRALVEGRLVIEGRHVTSWRRRMSDVKPVRRALLAVYDKQGVVDLARALVEMGVTLVSSGGTAATLADAGLPVTPVEQVTGLPEMLGGRVKTLHPAIHGGILADRRKSEHVEQLAEQGIEPFELVVVNLYPFRETVASGPASTT